MRSRRNNTTLTRKVDKWNPRKVWLIKRYADGHYAINLNAVAATAFLLDGPETLLRHIGLDERDTYTTKHEIDDLVTVVHITREEAPAWQH